MRAIFARAADGKHFQVFYVTPDGKAEIGGIMWNAAGRNITLNQVRAIPGVMPTVRIGAAAGAKPTQTVTYGADPALMTDPTAFRVAAPSSSVAASAAAILRQAAETTHGTAGKPDARGSGC